MSKAQKKTEALGIDKTKNLFAGISKLLTTVQNIDQVLAKIMEEVELFFNPTNWSLFRLDDASNELFFEIVKGIDPEKVKEIRLKLGEGIAGKVAKTGETILLEDVSKSKEFSTKVDKASGFVTKSIVAVPIQFNDRIFGVIQLINKADGSNFSEQDLFVLETIGKFSGIAFVNAMYYEELSNIAQRDPLTGLYNRVKLDKVLNSWKGQSNEFITVALIDLNDFKIINDTQGHKAGDHLLRNASQYMTSCLNFGDMLFRLGGDEFLILAESSKDSFKSVEESLGQKMNAASQAIKHQSGFAFGLCSGKRGDIDRLIAEADKNMYAQKASTKHKKSNR